MIVGMRTLLALAFVLGACGGDDVEPQFETVSCLNNWGSGYPNCQQACQIPPEPPSGQADSCDVGFTVHNGETIQGTCGVTFDWEGIEGCCKGDGDTIFFVQCD